MIECKATQHYELNVNWRYITSHIIWIVHIGSVILPISKSFRDSHSPISEGIFPVMLFPAITNKHHITCTNISVKCSITIIPSRTIQSLDHLLMFSTFSFFAPPNSEGIPPSSLMFPSSLHTSKRQHCIVSYLFANCFASANISIHVSWESIHHYLGTSFPMQSNYLAQ